MKNETRKEEWEEVKEGSLNVEKKIDHNRWISNRWIKMFDGSDIHGIKRIPG